MRTKIQQQTAVLIEFWARPRGGTFVRHRVYRLSQGGNLSGAFVRHRHIFRKIEAVSGMKENKLKMLYTRRA